MPADTSKGWFSIPGIRPHADRTIEEQMRGLDEALRYAEGKRVLDLGCAEGAISREFARAGARLVRGVEILEPHLEVARRWCADFPQVEFVHANLRDYPKMLRDPPPQYEIVLALGIIHKLKHPDQPLRFAAQSCTDLLLFRAPAHAWNGWVRSKHWKNACHVPTVMAEEGFELREHFKGARGEGVEYWWRRR